MAKNKLSARWFRFLLNAYPPFIFNRIRIKYIATDYKEITVKVKKSLLNKNLAGTIFGGTIFSAADPFYPLMYWQIFAHRYNEQVLVWLKSAEIDYLRPSATHLTLSFKLTEADIVAARESLDIRGKHNATHEVLIYDTKNTLCARVKIVAFIGKKEMTA